MEIAAMLCLIAPLFVGFAAGYIYCLMRYKLIHISTTTSAPACAACGHVHAEACECGCAAFVEE